MLNTNQSNKRNAWKYFVVLPLLAFFMFQFQMKVLAQEKSAPVMENKRERKEVVSVVIDKNTSDAEIKKDIEMLKNDFGVTLKVSKIKRNSKGEITAIKVDFKDKDGRKGTSQVSSDAPIQPIRFFKEMDENGKGAIGFGTPKERGPREGLAKIKTIKHLNKDGEDLEVIVEGDDDAFAWSDNFDFDFEIPEVPETPEAEGAPGVPKPPKAPKTMKKTVVVKEKDGKKEVWINGEKVSEDVFGEMDFNDMEKAFAFSFDSKGPKGEKGPKDFIFKDEDGNMVISRKEIEKIRKEAMDGAKIHMERARKHMEEMRPEIERAKIRMREAQPEMENARQEMMKAKEEMMKAKAEMEKAKAELEKAKAELKNKKA